MVQGLGLCVVTAKGPASVTDCRTKIPQAAWQKKKKKIIVTEVKTQWIKHKDTAEGRIHIIGRQS